MIAQLPVLRESTAWMGAAYALARAGYVAALLFACLSPLHAAGCPDARDLAFLQGLNREGQFTLAAFQAELYLRANDTCPAQPEFDLELGKALYQLGGFPRAREVLKPHLRLPDPRYRRYYFESRLLDMADPRQADSALGELSDSALPAEERSLFSAGALFLKGDAYAARQAWPMGADRAADCAAAGKPWCYLEKGFQSPATAGWLSLAPGAGYAYAGRPGDALFALTVVSAFYGIAAYYAHYDSPARAGTFAAFGAVFHASNIYGAQRAAKESNRRKKLGFLMALHDRIFQ